MHDGGGGGDDWAPAPPQRRVHPTSPIKSPAGVNVGNFRPSSRVSPGVGGKFDFGSPHDHYRSPNRNNRSNVVSPDTLKYPDHHRSPDRYRSPTVASSRGGGSTQDAASGIGSRRRATGQIPEHCV